MVLSRSSYYDNRNRQSAALIRARRPYLVKNAVVGLSISAFAIGICTAAPRLPALQLVASPSSG
ncbi:predicted protein [Chaetomium globosum CBS 148.51]|uniref:Cytochrome c oxidase assembly factor 3 n=1 Tax=Chaetomium globosum (strain ATCC 6205 / CBS 148.51 / DSM 1962 / NBRC 6347 / NRRL 1970) TaxID=306901 RepID=Q2HDA8_CHAGB|nr:uncharacterized protein CHGG_01796 [Chaetomium globosum CBS 148.51]EAQ93561.1 predicted protein [Chaetomium globosum CBS 148.51]